MARRLLADEMLGKLARDLRILGHDVAYARDLHDDEVLAWAGREGRVLLTRDQQLAARAGEAGLLVSSLDPAEQLDEVIAALELTATDATFLSRCLVCNEPLVATDPGRVPSDVRATEAWACPACDRLYWDGSHVADMRHRLARHLSDGERARPKD